MTALMSSKNRFVASLFVAEELKDDEKDPSAFKTVSRGGGGRRGGSKIPTVGAQFNVSLTGLMALLSSCNPYFVRCIKPNANKKAREVWNLTFRFVF
jgi:myosin heavy subunit